MLKEERARSYLGLVLCVVFFIVGRVLLDRVSVMENPPFGNTFYILLGNLLMACSLIGAGLIGRHVFRLHRKEKNKKSSSRVVFLDGEKKQGKGTRRASS